MSAVIYLHRTRKIIAGLLFTALVALGTVQVIPVPVARAQIVVTDPGNTAQNLLTALRTLQSNINEAQMIANQLKNLQQLGYTSTGAYTSQYTSFLTQVGNVQGILGNTITAERTFQNQYPTFANSPQYSGTSMLTNMTNWQTSLSSSMANTVGTASSTMQAIPATQANMNNLLSASNNSQGMLQATQAGNQMVATVSGQLTQMNAQLATYETAHAQYLAQQQSQQAAAQAASNHIYSDYNTDTSQGTAAPMPGQSR